MPLDKQPEFRLKREPDGRSWTARENLVDILERELPGPGRRPGEILDGRTVCRDELSGS